MAYPQSVPDNRLGLTGDEIYTLRQHQQLALQHANGHGNRHAGSSSSRAASQASSQGRLLLDPTSLSALSQHFDRVMHAIQQRLHVVSSSHSVSIANHQLNQQTEIAVQRQTSLAQMSSHQADAEIARFRAILHQIDELETEFDKIRHIREIVRSFRARVEMLERRLG